MSEPKLLIAILGPTAIGKTRLSISIAKHWDMKIISADSRQIYKEMSIGTAKPSPEELEQVPHHFIDKISIEESYSAGQFEKDALERLQNIYKEKDIALLVGGSGLYLQAVLEGFDDLPEVPSSVREKTKQAYQEKGLNHLQKELKEQDPEYYEEVDRSNPQRLIRALEVCYTTGKPYSSFRQQQPAPRPFDNTIKIGLNMDRKKLHERINNRVERMLEEGLLQEVKELYPQRNLKTVNTVGYQELFDYMDGDISFERAIELIKRNTRRFAKRQLTWFRRDEEIKWFHPSEKSVILEYLEQQIKSIQTTN